MANNAQAFQRGEHPGYEETAWEGIEQTIDVIAEKGIKIVINGGALNPKGLALKVDELVGIHLPLSVLSAINILRSAPKGST